MFEVTSHCSGNSQHLVCEQRAYGMTALTILTQYLDMWNIEACIKKQTLHCLEMETQNC